MNITEKLRSTFTKKTLNRTQPHFGKSKNKHIQIQQGSNKPQNSTQKKVNENIQSITNKYKLFIHVNEKSEERKTM